MFDILPNPVPMKQFFFKKIFLILLWFPGALIFSQGEAREFYALKIYSFDSISQEKGLDSYLKDAYLPALKRQDIVQVGVFKFHRDTETAASRIFVLIPFTELSQFADMETNLMADNIYQDAAEDHLSAPHDHPPYARVETILMRAFTDMPMLKIPQLEGDRTARVYEVRSYESPNEHFYSSKVDMFNAGGEIKLFDRLGFNAVFYADVLAGSHMPNLMYMTAFADMESRDAHWKAFFDSPEWKELSAMEKYRNNVSHADIMLLYPTPYSDY